MLSVQGLRAGYGPQQVLHGVDLSVAEGEVVALLGRNGAGRSTTLKALMGLLPAQGRVAWRGESLLGLPAFQIARRGIGYVPETRDVFPGLSVEQNLVLGRQPGARASSAGLDLDAAYARFPRLRERRHAPAGALSGGEQQMLALCRTLMGGPRLVLVDEPTEGLSPQAVAQVRDFLLSLKAQGVGMLLVEQKLAIALDIADRVLVMGHGRIVHQGTPASLLAEEAVRRDWLGV